MKDRLYKNKLLETRCKRDKIINRMKIVLKIIVIKIIIIIVVSKIMITLHRKVILKNNKYLLLQMLVATITVK